MDSAHLIRMVNQIADFFAAYPEEQAVAATADHIRQFWDPRMRAGLTDLVEAAQGGLSEIAGAAARRLQTSADEETETA